MPASRSPAVVLGICALAAVSLLTPSCASDGQFSILGYTTRPNYDLRYKTVSVPIFKNKTYWVVTPVVGMEMDLTRAVVREIELKTPYKVAQDNADTEIIGTITNFQKNLLNYTAFNTIRDAETVLTVELVWRDRRTGEVLTKSSRRFGQGLDEVPRRPLLATPDSLLPPGSKPLPVTTPDQPTEGIVGTGDDDTLTDPLTKKKIKPVVIRSTASFRPELGESLTSSMQRNFDRMAVQIVSVMESGW